MEYYPQEHIPTELIIGQRVRKLTFGVGNYRNAKYEMSQGPFESLVEALETVPADRQAAYIIRFNENGIDEAIYQWQRNRWIRYVTRG